MRDFVVFIIPLLVLGLIVIKNRYLGAFFIVAGYFLGLSEYLAYKIGGEHVDLFTLLRIDTDMLLMAPKVIGKLFSQTIILTIFVMTLVIAKLLINNRDELVKVIESMGGKVVPGVTKKTDYLINNDPISNSSKNRKAKELGIQILSEEIFLKIMSKSIDR